MRLTMRLRITTETGSTYLLDSTTMRWERIPTERSGKIRTESGEIRSWPVVEIGAPLVVMTNPVEEGVEGRYIRTSPVTTIERLG